MNNKLKSVGRSVRSSTKASGITRLTENVKKCALLELKHFGWVSTFYKTVKNKEINYAANVFLSLSFFK